MRLDVEAVKSRNVRNLTTGAHTERRPIVHETQHGEHT